MMRPHRREAKVTVTMMGHCDQLITWDRHIPEPTQEILSYGTNICKAVDWRRLKKVRRSPVVTKRPLSS